MYHFFRTSFVLLTSILALAGAFACSETTTTQGAGGDDGFVDREFDEDVVSTGDDDEMNTVDEFTPREGPMPEGIWTPESGQFVLEDRETGTLWNLRGEAFDGPLAGAKLEQIAGFNAFWFAWSTFNHGSEVWNRDEVNDVGEIVPSGTCEVPCSEINLGCGGGRDCIPALDHDGINDRPVAEMVAADDPGASYLGSRDFVLGVVHNGQARAYPHNILWWHEIYNDQIDDLKFSVTFCPLTGSGIVFPGERSGTETTYEVSGNLYNSNLVMIDRETETLWSQMYLRGISGPERGERLEILPVVETTWERWKQMYPETRVASNSQGYSRDYARYPYGNYRTNQEDTFRATNPDFSDMYRAKDRVLGVYGSSGTARAYAMPEMETLGDRVVIRDTLDGEPVVIVYEAESRLALPFRASYDGKKLTFDGAQAP